MTDAKIMFRRWEDMEVDVLVKIFKELNMIELGPVSQVCRSWHLACSDPLLWNFCDLGLLKSNFIQTRASPYIYVGEKSSQRLTRVLRISMALSRGNIRCIVFHFNLYMKDDHLSYIAQRCPNLKRLVLPAWNCFTKIGISQAISRWENLESMTMPNIAHPPYIMEQIHRCCKNFSQLKVMGCFDKTLAVSIFKSIPNLKVLSVRCTRLSKEALLFILDHMQHLEVLNISHCILMEGSISSSSVPTKIIKELDSTILEKASKLRFFFHCIDDSCITCQRMLSDDGYMRWYKYEDWFWRRDEISSLDLGDYGKMFDRLCVELISKD